MLCETCQGIFNRETPSLNQSSPHHETFATLHASVLSGCPICRKAWKVFERSAVGSTPVTPSLETKNAVTEHIVYQGDLPKGELSFRIMCEHEGSHSNADFKLVPVSAVSTGLNIRQASSHSEAGDVKAVGEPKMDDEVGLDSRWTTVERWFQDCVSGHESCSQAGDRESWYPTRLLDLGDTTTSAVKIIDTRTTEPTGRYVSLSHRWGGHVAMMTTSDTIGSFMESIDFKKLPRTFQDAIVVTRRLGVRYLWIDSLCIIQNHSDDWQREAGNMGHVYRHAFCNISALVSRSSSEGFLSRQAGSVQPIVIHLKWNGYSHEPHTAIDEGFWTDRIQDAPLNRRGWVFQERLLAPRVLHFSSEQVFWECEELDACETYPKGLPSAMVYASMKLSNELSSVTPTAQHQRIPAGEGPDCSLYRGWHAVLEGYSRCSLTMEKDKLVAISGIAKTFQAKLKDDYLAGLWRRVLVTDMLWRVSSRGNEASGHHARRPKEYRAPSWSWASVDGVIQPGHAARDEAFLLASVVDAKVSLLSEDPTGQIVDGAIRLRGSLYPCSATIENKRFRLAGLKGSSGKTVAHIEYDVRPRPLPQTRAVYCLPLLCSNGDSDDRFFVWGLGLEAVEGRQGVYKRFGNIQVSGMQEWEALQKEGTAEDRRKLYCVVEDGELVLI